MVKSPEQYLSSLSFSLPSDDGDKEELNAGERAFVEKYLGMDMFQKMPELAPEPVLMPASTPPPPRPLALMERRIVVAQPKQELAEKESAAKTPTSVMAQPVIEIAPVQKTEVEVEAEIVTAAPVVEQAEVAQEEKTVSATVETADKTQATEAIEEKPQVSVSEKEAAATEAAVVAPSRLSMRERLKTETEIQMVSFFVSGQIFLLPVPEIQEVLRHMELVKVPQAPSFVAGAINLRGRVMPLIHLSSLLTNEPVAAYTEKNFIIVCGSDDLQLGLIIDKISSMHMVPQEKIIWNVESMLGEVSEIVCAVANLDEKVTGIVDPGTITRKLLDN